MLGLSTFCFILPDVRSIFSPVSYLILPDVRSIFSPPCFLKLYGTEKTYYSEDMLRGARNNVVDNGPI
jgi:hypothetical protein